MGGWSPKGREAQAEKESDQFDETVEQSSV
jgi:hypothetical protein